MTLTLPLLVDPDIEAADKKKSSWSVRIIGQHNEGITCTVNFPDKSVDNDWSTHNLIVQFVQSHDHMRVSCEM